MSATVVAVPEGPVALYARERACWDAYGRACHNPLCRGAERQMLFAAALGATLLILDRERLARDDPQAA